jgi:hypothetical protein
MGFYDYVSKYYSDQIATLEEVVTKHDNIINLKNSLQRAANLKKFLNDIREEGYEATYQSFCVELNAIERLEQVLAAGLPLLGTENEAELFYLCKSKSQLDLTIATDRFEIYELDDYLAKLEQLGRDDLAVAVLEKPKYAKRLEQVEIILDEMVAYIRWLLEPGRVANYLFLLRDTLLPYLGIRELDGGGSKVAALPVFISRKFMGAFGNEKRLFNLIADPIYDCLTENDAQDLACFCADYQLRLQSYCDLEYEALAEAIKQYLQPKLVQDTYTVVESGVQGSIPLMLQAFFPQINGFEMYTTVPWLYRIYQPHIFQPNYNYLRDTETFLAHDRLFSFTSFQNGRVYIHEYQDADLQCLAYYEIVRLKEKLNSAALKSK